MWSLTLRYNSSLRTGGCILKILGKELRTGDSFYCSGGADYIVAFKLKALKEKLKEWSRTFQGNLGLPKQNVLKQLAELEEIQEQCNMGDCSMINVDGHL